MLPLLALLSTSWLGITLGEPYAAVHDRMGDPVVSTKAADVTKFVYLTAHENAFLTVMTERGRVSGIRLWALPTATPQTADPAGIRIDEDVDKLLSVKGKPSRTAADADGPFDAYQNGDVLWLYHLNGNQTVRTITLSASDASMEDLPEVPLPQLHAGTSPADAVVMSASAGGAARWESMFFAVRPCGSNGTWRQTKRTSETIGGVAYDAVSVACSSGNASQTRYFKPSASK